MIVTTEHAATGKMGGIGSYNQEVGAFSPQSVFLLVDDDLNESPAPNIIILHEYVKKYFPELKPYLSDQNLLGYVILEVVQRLLVEYPAIKTIDSHEYSGIAARLSEASRTGLLPRNVGVRIYCHGGHIQLERATATWGGLHTFCVNNLERSSIENADEVWFSSVYLRDLYVNAGIRIDQRRVSLLGYPYQLSARVTQPAFTDLDTLVFVGRINRLKGYDVYVEVVKALLAEEKLRRRIKIIYAIGKDDDSLVEQRESLRILAESLGIEYVQKQMTRDELLAFESEQAGNALFVLPYMSDNYSVAILELIEKMAPVLCLRTGGTAELVKDKRWSARLADDTQGLIRLVRSYVEMVPSQRQRDAADLHRVFVALQQQTNERNKQRMICDMKVSEPRGDQTTIETIVVSRDGGGTGNIINPLTGHFSVGGQPQPFPLATHFLLLAENIILGSEANAHELLKRAIVGSDANTGFSFGVRSGNSIDLALNVDLGLLVYAPKYAAHTNLCIPSGLLAEFLKIYQKDQSVTTRTTGHFFMMLVGYALARRTPIVPIPKIMATGTTLPESVTGEVSFTTLAKYREEKDWAHYRFMALIRSNVQLGGGPAPISVPVAAPQDTINELRTRALVLLTLKRVYNLGMIRMRKILGRSGASRNE